MTTVMLEEQSNWGGGVDDRNCHSKGKGEQSNAGYAQEVLKFKAWTF